MEIISKGTPFRLACVAEYLRRSWATCLGVLKAFARRGALQGFLRFKLHFSIRKLQKAFSWAYRRRRVDLESFSVRLSRKW